MSPAAHPRSRGENYQAAKPLGRKDGSSPLTRGKPDNHGDQWCEGGLIPAHAGKTSSCAVVSVWIRAHPRSRGENFWGSLVSVMDAGSSPLTRGKHRARGQDCPQARLIPAHAGKTFPGGRRRGHGPAHPRSRGENSATPTVKGEFKGSSPLTRGKHCAPRPTVAPCRLIPAHAGKTHRDECSACCCQAHPRSRGENSGKLRYSRVVEGSSPLTRGKPADLRQQEKAARLIPAHAGKTVRQRGEGPTLRAHPRSRGENTSAARSKLGQPGSSPLTRGKP